ncbi:MAG: hypothetical protein HYR62_06755 [Actinobacteria bacterium]|nr:hypothetical protein [Actinomycetota bacterium]MBI3687214.1 hypothetical protein [Actinomycetota bacterium]
MNLARPISGHVLQTDALPQLDIPLAPGGLVVGHDGHRQPVIARIFRDRPTQIGVFGAAYLGKLLAFRALAVAAQVSVLTPRPATWEPLVRAAPAQWAAIMPAGTLSPHGATATRPSLIVEDAGMGEAQLRSDLGSWQTQAVLRPFVTPQMEGLLQAFDLVLVQRAQPETVPTIQAAFGLPEAITRWLPQMPDDTVALIAVATAQFVNLAPTSIEETVFGPPTLLDG